MPKPRASPAYSSADSSPESSSPASSYYDDSSEIDELEYRSRKLTDILKKNIDRAERRKTLFDVVRDRAWLLEDQVKLLEKQTKTIKSSLGRKSIRQRLLTFGAVMSSLILIGVGLSHVIHPSDTKRN